MTNCIAANGVLFFKHIPVFRYLCRELGAYDGDSSFDKYVIDAVSELYIDWRVSSCILNM